MPPTAGWWFAGGGPLIAVTKDRFRIARPTTDFMSRDAFELQAVPMFES